LCHHAGKADFGGRGKVSGFCGVELDVSQGERGGDGKVFGKEYFACDQGHAVFTSRKKVAVLPGYGATARETQASARESELEAALAASQAEVLQLRAELAGYKQNATE